MKTWATGLVLTSLQLAASGLFLGATWAQNNSAEQFKAIGKLLTASGAVFIEHTAAVLVQARAPAGDNVRAKVGDLVYQGDVIQTGVDGAVGIVFTDGTSFNISSNARMELNELIYDPKGNSNSTLFNLKKGTFTFIAGAIAKTGNMKVETPVGTMGIRGTAPRVEILEDGTVRFSTLIEENKKAGAAPSAAPGASSSGQGPTDTLKDLELCNATDRASAQPRILACTALVELRVDNPQALAIAYNNRGSARASTGDIEGAIQDYDLSIRFDPAYDKPFNNRGVVYQKKGDFDRAIRDFDAAINISPGYVSALANRAQTYEKKRDYDRALSDFNEAIRLQPTWGDLWNERCWIRAITGAHQEALADCNEAIRLGPASAPKFDSRGFVYLKSGQWQLAIADFDSALQLKPRLASSLYGRGYARLKAGELSAGNADIAAATRIQRNIADEYIRYGLQ